MPSVGGRTARVVCRNADLSSAERGIFWPARMGRVADADLERLRYVDHMRRLRTIVGTVREHPFATDAVLAVVLAVLVLSEVFTSGGYLTGSKWVYVPSHCS